MPREPKIVFVSDEEYAAQRKAQAERCQRFLVTGEPRIRDAITREFKTKGEYVWIDPEETVIAINVHLGFMKAAPEDAPAADSAAAEAPKAKVKAS